MARGKEKLEEARDEPSAASPPRLTPPPRVGSRPGRARPEPARERGSRAVMWLTVAFFAALGVAAIAVFVVLPDWVSARQQADELARTSGNAQAEIVPVDPAGDEVVLEAANQNAAPAPELLEFEPLGEPAAAAPTVDQRKAPREVTREPPPAKRAPRNTEPPASSARPTGGRPPGSGGFERAMSEGLTALDRGDHTAARDAFSRAAGLRPDSPQTADGLARAEAGLRLTTITELRRQALAFESEEDWGPAAERYEAVLRVDSTVEFAQRGGARSRERAELSRRLDFHLANPQRLSSDEVLQEASAVLAQASDIDPAGPRLRRQVSELASQVEAYSVPMRATLESDELTEVTVYRIGRLGTFRRHALELRPGTYTVVGSRRGYRDVRRQLVIAPGAEPQPLIIRCEEEI